MTRCDECGARNAENATFCVRCGADIVHGQEPAVGENTDTLDPVGEATMASATVGPAMLEEPEPMAPNGAADASEAAELVREAGQRLSDGDADGAAVKCRDAIERAPDLVAAYSLLGMAEEQRGNIVAAAGAYRRVLQLDPERKIEREKLEFLYADGLTSGGEDRAESSLDSRIVAWAPWVAAVGAAFVVLAILTFVGVRVHAGNAAERSYADQMQVAQVALDSGNYATASRAFETALAARPGDADAERGLGYARRKLAARGASRAPDIVAQPMPYTAQIVPSTGPNPFTPIPIGTGQVQGAEPQPGQPPMTQSTPRTRTAPPPVMPRDQRVEVQRPATTTPGDTIMPFGDVLDDPQDGGATQPAQADDVEPDDTQVAEPPASEGECTIWRSPRGSTGGQATTSAPTGASSDAGHAQSAEQLRRQARSAIQGGNCDQGQQLLDQAIEQYKADSEANPGRRAANQASINSCEAMRQQCESGE